MGCLNHLKVCKAECCREFRLILPQPFDTSQLVRGNKVSFYKVCNKDKQRYYQLHNVRYVYGRIIFILNDFELQDNVLVVRGDCKGLTNDCLCKYHGTSYQPKICQQPNEKENKNLKDVFITPNCVYKEVKNG